MGKNKNNLLFVTSLISAISVVVSMTFFTVAKAEQNHEQSRKIGENSTSTIKNEADDENEVEVDENEGDGQFDNKEHWNKEKNFEHKLLDIADEEDNDKDDEDGQEIRDIADEQNGAASTTAHTIEEIEHRNKIQTFLFGSDYKNLGALRSDIVQTRNRLDRLDKIAEHLQNATGTAEIQAQSQVLEEELAKMENFINEQESKFSLFGWLIKMFSK